MMDLMRPVRIVLLVVAMLVAGQLTEATTAPAYAQAVLPRLPTMVRLKAGSMCQFTYDATFVVAGDRANYVCSDGYSYLVGYPHQSVGGSVQIIQVVLGVGICGTEPCAAGLGIVDVVAWSGSEDDNCGAHYCEWVVQPDHKITGADLRDQQSP